MEKMKVYTQEEALDMTIGEKGTPAREEYESMVQDYLIGAAIKEAREARHLTQEQLGKKIGVQKARICSIEKGVNLRLSTLRRIFIALGLEVKLDIAEMRPIPIC
ncbi:MAG: helix-turn-helix transcriptional regulator [Muribaculaceae bacterium]|nr:helix-turn-helix transcriptional regulator [Muribaculaceae bacterium]